MVQALTPAEYATDDGPALAPLGSALQDFDAELSEEPEQIPDEEKYWAERSDQAFVAILKQKQRDYFEFAQNHGFIDISLQMLSEYFGKDPTSFSGFDAVQVGFEGDDSELVRFRVAELRVYIRQAITAATKERPSFKAGTLNTNHAAGAQVDTVDTVVNFAYEKWMGEKRERKLVERGELIGLMYVWCRWDDHGGEIVKVPVTIPAGTKMPDGSVLAQPLQVPGEFETVRTGAPMLRVKPWWDVIGDPTVDDVDDHAWRAVRERRSKWELIRAYPECKDAIKGASITSETAWELLMAFDENLASDDDVMVTHFYHPPNGDTEAGVYALVCGDKVLTRTTWDDAPVAGSTMPIKRYAVAEMFGSSFGYSESWDQLVLQQMETQVISDIATNISTLGRQFIMLPQGSEISPEQLANGAFAAYVPEDQMGKISAPNLAQIGTGAQWFVGFIQKMHQLLAGQNSVSMGDPVDNIKSGNMAALFHAIALEHGHPRQATLDGTREEVATMLVDFMRKYMKGEYLARLVGEDEKDNLGYFTADTLGPVKQVFVKTANPALRTRSGQLEFANYVKDIPGAVTTPSQALQVFTTGQVRPLYRSAESKLSRIQWENERLREGPPVEQVQVPAAPDPMTGMPPIDPMTGMPAMDVELRVPTVPAEMTDNPFEHVNEHLVVKNDPTITPQAKEAVEAHILEHMRVYAKVPPTLASVLGFPPAMSPPPMGGPDPSGGAKGGKGGGKPPESMQTKGSPIEEQSPGGLPAPAKPPPGSAAAEA